MTNVLRSKPARHGWVIAAAFCASLGSGHALATWMSPSGTRGASADSTRARPAANQESRVAREESQADALTAARLAVRALPMSEQDQTLARLLGSDADGARILEALRAGRLQEESPSAKVLAKAFLRGMRDDPEEGMRLVRVGLSRIELDADAFDRLSLLETLKSVGGHSRRAEIRALATSELTSHPIPARPDPESATTDEERDLATSTTFQMAYAVTAFDVALSTLDDPRQALGLALDGIAVQPDRGVRGGITSTLLTKFPSLERTLRDELSTRNIVVDEGFLVAPTPDPTPTPEAVEPSIP